MPRLKRPPQLRPELEPLPPRMRDLPIYRQMPVPYFVAWVDGVPEFRAADARKFALAIRGRLCWVCGQRIDGVLTYVIGPMCGINQTTAEPACHLDCARFSARCCPFLSRPHAHRREGIDGGSEPSGIAIMRNPGVTLLWTTRDYRLFDDGKGGRLIKIGEPIALEWYAEGRHATREQVAHSVDTGVPLLMPLAEQEGPAAVAELLGRKEWLESRYPR